MNHNSAKKIAKIIAIIIIITMVATTFSFVFYLPGLLGKEASSVVYAASSEEQYLDDQTDTLKELIYYIQNNYKDSVTADQLMNGAFNGVLSSLDDPYSIYYKTEDESRDFEEAVSGEFSGIGIVLHAEDGYCTVVSAIIDGPAEKAGILSGDKILSIDGKNMAGKNIEEVAQLLRGEEGTKVAMTVERGGKTYSYTLNREMIHTTSVNYKMLENKIGYMQITSFDSDTNYEFTKAKLTLKHEGAKAFIIDVRNNPGGYINTASKVAEQIMPAGPITHLKKQGKLVETISASGNETNFLPTVLLINKGSASASEILAGALQDSKSATLVGTTTYGKGVAQQIVEIADNKAMKLSMYYFLTPKMSVIDHIGIKPDYTVENSVKVDKEELLNRYAGFAPMSEKVKPKQGDVGLNVFGAQQRLVMLGYDLKATGLMDAKTVAAVKKFQVENGLAGYGVLDYTTMNKIDRVTIDFIYGIGGDKDAQLQKAIDLINQGKAIKAK